MRSRKFLDKIGTNKKRHIFVRYLFIRGKLIPFGLGYFRAIFNIDKIDESVRFGSIGKKYQKNRTESFNGKKTIGKNPIVD